MEAIKGYNEATAAGEGMERLPTGGYIAKILNAEEQKYDWGSVLVISFDILEGEHKDYYAKQYENQQQEDKKWKGNYRMNIPKGDGSEQDGWTMGRFKRDILAIEDSNNNFHWDWDEKKLKGQKVGVIMHDSEWKINGNSGFYTACHHFTSVETIKSGKFTIPKPRLLKDKSSSASELFGPEIDGVTPADDIELPF